MTMQDDAVSIMAEVRDFYAHGKKTINKAYVTGAPDDKPVRIRDPFEGKWQAWANQQMANKAQSRHQDGDVARMHRPQRQRDEDYFTYGMRIYNGGRRAAFVSGNCLEMAAVAAALAIATYRYAPGWVWMGRITAPGDHVFCLLSEHKPQWPNAAAMTTDMGAPGAWVIDPWLHTVCSGSGYWEAAKARLAAWNQQGKRIAWMGRGGDRLGWYAPGHEYLHAFGEGKLLFPLASPDV